MIIDGAGRRHAPGAVLLAGRTVIAAGSPGSIGRVANDITTLRLTDHVILPALVNAHAHLDLTHVGPVSYTGDFVSWVDVVRDRRAVDPELIAHSVAMGAALSLSGGTAIIGDIAGIGSLAAVEALRASELAGVSYVELFGQGPPEKTAAAHATIQSVVATMPPLDRNVRVGFQPHAPYSCAKGIYEATAALHETYPLATHLAETLDEITFSHEPRNSAFAQLLADRGVWDDSITGYGCHPIDALADIFEVTPFLAVHLNYIDDVHIDLLARWPIHVAYCPRASAYFGHHAQPDGPTTSHHRYQDMLSAGVNVALGTDSILCLDTPDRISVLDEMRLLYQRDGTTPERLLRMASVNGAHALGFDPQLVTFDPGPIAGVIALPFDPSRSNDPFAQVLERVDAPQWIVGP